MTGLFLNNHAVIDLSLRIPENDTFRFFDVEFTIDTGYFGELTLPSATLQALGLTASRTAQAKLADGYTIQVDIYEAEIIWQENIRTADIFALDDVPLLGTLLLDGCELNIRFADHEEVTVRPL